MSKYVNVDEVLKNWPKEIDRTVPCWHQTPYESGHSSAQRACRTAVESAPSINRLTVEEVIELLREVENVRFEQRDLGIRPTSIDQIAQAIVALQDGV